jgi:chromosome segregation ATPase
MTMADRGPNWTVERVRLEAQIEDHEDTIAAGTARLNAIARAKAANQRRADLANLDLDAEAQTIRENEAALKAKQADIRKNLEAMTKKEKGD